MIRNGIRLCLRLVLPLAAGLAWAALPPVATHENHAPAGELRDGVLTLRLEVGEGLWHPESDDGPALAVYAFAEAGKPLQNPGPLVRVPQGTEIAASVHNSMPIAISVHGLCARPCAPSAVLQVPAGETRQVRFKAGLPGLFYYWAASGGATLSDRPANETQLNGAFVVDPPGQNQRDEIFVISVLADGPAAQAVRFIATINGKSWPHTPRFAFQVGETARWRWINASEENHAMHLHGFYYRVEAMGDGNRVRSFAGEERPRVVTQRIDPGATFDMTWVPERAGRWLFHCHMVAHMVPAKMPKATLMPASAPPGPHSGTHDATGMGQLVLGVTVSGGAGDAAPPVWRPARKLELVIGERPGGTPRYALNLRDAAQPAAEPDDARLIGPMIVLTRDQPVEIEVLNRIQDPTAIHWHGIELESYYDGVPGWTGTASQITPAIAPGSSFVARMTPPRAGTFIYHTHWHDENQLQNGIYGPLIVLPPGAKFDPQSDLVFVFGLGRFSPFGPLLLINGRPQLPPLRLQVGKKYRLRLINIAPNNVAMEASLRGDAGPAQWRIVAKDGADLPAAAVKPAPATTPITVGETYDAEFEVGTAQELQLDVYLPGPKVHTTQTLVFAAAGKSR